MSVPTTVTVSPGPFNDAKPPSLKESADSAAPVIDPLIVAPFRIVVLVVVEPDKRVGAEGDDDPPAPVASPVAISDRTIRILI